jgi:hypothetical protein
MSWSEAQVDGLIAGVEKGVEYKVISKLTDKSVGAVCAKVDRLRKEGRLPEARQITSSTTQKKVVVPKSQSAYLMFRPKMQANPANVALLKKLEEEGHAATDLITLEERLKNEEEGRPTCCYPVGDPRETGRVYCSKPRLPGMRWCAEHYARCHDIQVVTVKRFKGEVRELETA